MSAFATPYESLHQAAGQVPAGALFISVKNTGRRRAQVNGIALEPGEVRNYPFLGKPYQPIPFDPAGGELTVLYIL